MSCEGPSTIVSDEKEKVSDGSEFAFADLLQEPLKDHSTDIKNDLRNALLDASKTSGSFYSKQAYLHAPNPVIDVAGFGRVGLPLSTVEAKRLIGVCDEAKFGKGERTIIDKSVRDTWEIDASKIKFDNASWHAWLQTKVVPEIYETLGVQAPSGSVRAELYKMLLYEKGSHFLPHQDTAKAPGMFATVVIVLPTEFTGGELQLSHAGKEGVIDIASASLLTTHVLAWYTDVFHSIKPVESGFRLALSYNLVHNVALPKPALLGLGEASGAIKHVMQSWRQAATGIIPVDDPELILYLLDHQYSKHELRSACLKGADSNLVAQLGPAAEAFEFGLYLAQVELHQRGMPSGGVNCACQCEDGEMGEVHDEDFVFKNVVDLDGVAIQNCKMPDFAYKAGEVIPRAISDGKPDDTEYEPYTGNEGGDIDHWYRRTVLIISPDPILFGKGNATVCASENLQRSESAEPTERDKALVKHLLAVCRKSTLRENYTHYAVPVLTRCAQRWESRALWVKTLAYCDDDLKLEALGLYIDGGYLLCGFKLLEEHLNVAIANDRTNVNRLDVIDRLSTEAIRLKDEYVIQWCEKQHNAILSSLEKPAEGDDKLFYQIVKDRGCTYLKESLLPNLLKSSGSFSFWFGFISQLRQNRASISPNPDTVDAIISALVPELLPHAPPFPKQFIAKKRDSASHSTHKTPDMEEWSNVVRLLLEMDSTAVACTTFLEKMRTEYEASSIRKKQWVGEFFIEPAIKHLDAILVKKGSEVLKPELFSKFFAFALDVLIAEYLPKDLTEWGSSAFSVAFKWLQDYCSLKESLLSYSKVLTPQNLQPALLIAEALDGERIKVDVTKRQDLEDIISEIANAIINVADLSSLPWSYRYGARLVGFCASVLDGKLAQALFKEFVRPNLTRNLVEHIKDGLSATILSLKNDYVRRKNVVGGLTSEPYRTFVGNVLREYANTVLGPEPCDIVPVKQLQGVGCGCKKCQALRDFFCSGEKKVFLYDVEEKATRSHLEKELEKTRLWGTTWEAHTVDSTSPPKSLEIVKSDLLVAPGQWIANQRDGLKLIKDITGGDDAVLQKILGDDYVSIVTAFGGQVSASAGASIATKRTADEISDGGAQDPSATKRKK